METRLQVGIISSTHGIRGEVRCSLQQMMQIVLKTLRKFI